jgi:hypothetical protein
MREELFAEMVTLHRMVCNEWCGGVPGDALCDGDCRDAASVTEALDAYRREILKDAAQYLRDAAQYGDTDVYTLPDLIDPDVDIAGYVGLRHDGQ